MASDRKRAMSLWLVAAGLVLAAVALLGTYVYANYVRGEPPAELAVGAVPTRTGAAGTVDGSWATVAGSLAGYRVEEVLAGQSVTAVGRTGAVTGSVLVEDSAVLTAEIVVDMRSVRSDNSRRDAQFAGRIMQTDEYPEARFVLAEPFRLDGLAASDGGASYAVDGELTLRGVTAPVAASLDVVRDGPQVRIAGRIPVVFADYGIDNPSIAGVVTTEDEGLIEVLVTLERT